MTLTEKSVKRPGESMRILFTKEQERQILEQFGTEPEQYEWSEQGIATQIRKICGSWRVQQRGSKSAAFDPIRRRAAHSPHSVRATPSLHEGCAQIPAP